MIIILRYYICEKRSFSFASLNARIHSFNYNLNNLGNKPPSFTYEYEYPGWQIEYVDYRDVSLYTTF